MPPIRTRGRHCPLRTVAALGCTLLAWRLLGSGTPDTSSAGSGHLEQVGGMCADLHSVDYERQGGSCRLPVETLKVQSKAERTRIYRENAQGHGASETGLQYYNRHIGSWLVGEPEAGVDTYSTGPVQDVLLVSQRLASYEPTTVHVVGKPWLPLPMWLCGAMGSVCQVTTDTPNKKAFSFLKLVDVMNTIDARDRSSSNKNASEGKGFSMSVGGSDFNTRWLDTATRDGMLFNLQPMSMGKATSIIGASAPADMLREMDTRHAPKNFDVMKIDMDGFECDVLETLLSKGGYHPRVIVSEASPSWVPPLRFRMNHNDVLFFGGPNYEENFLLYGCSLQATAELLAPYGYTLVQYVMEDAWWIRTDYLDLFVEDVNHPPSLIHLFRNGNPHFYRKLGSPHVDTVGYWSGSNGWKRELGRCISRCAYLYPINHGDGIGAEHCWGSIMEQFELQIHRQYAELFETIKAEGKSLNFEFGPLTKSAGDLVMASCDWRTSCGGLLDYAAAIGVRTEAELRQKLDAPCALSDL